MLATGTLSRFPNLPVIFLIDLEGPYCPGKQIRIGRENNEPWVNSPIVKRLVVNDVIHGGNIYNDDYWNIRDASVYIKQIPCPYLRIQFNIDHALGDHKDHMIKIINTATEYSGQWTRCNNNKPNIIYNESEINTYNFASGSYNEVLLSYAKEMFFEKPWLDK